MPNEKPGELRNLRIKRVALVDVGANFDKATGDGAHIMLFKGGPFLSGVHVDSTYWDDYEKANLSSATRDNLKDSDFAAVWTDAQGNKQRKLPIHDAGHLAAARGRIDGADIPASVKAEARRKIEAATKKKEKSVKKSILEKMLGLFKETDATKREAAAEELLKAFPPDDNDEDDLKKAHDPKNDMCKCADCMSKRATKKKADDDAAAVAAQVAKGVGEEVAKQMVTLTKANDELRASLNAEIEKRADAEMRDILKAFKATPINLDKDVATFRKMKVDNPAMFERTMEILKATDAQLATSSLYRNVGVSGGQGGTAWDQIEAKADQMVEKSTTPMTREKAIEKVMLAHPKLAKQYREEQQ